MMLDEGWSSGPADRDFEPRTAGPDGCGQCRRRAGGEGECEMKIQRSVAVWLVAVGVSIGATGAALAQGQHGGGMGGGIQPNPGGPQPSGSTITRQIPANQSPQPTLPSIGGTSLDDQTGPVRNPRTEEEMEKMRNADRQKKLMADTDRLLSLANELKLDMDKANKDTLSLDVVRKADEIEKLAHSVKERMKGQ
jgi:hypothetical protein